MSGALGGGAKKPRAGEPTRGCSALGLGGNKKRAEQTQHGQRRSVPRPGKFCSNPGSSARVAGVYKRAEPSAQKKAPRREGQRGAERRTWAGGQFKRAEQFKPTLLGIVPAQASFF
jgi:hypothetical protein